MPKSQSNSQHLLPAAGLPFTTRKMEQRISVVTLGVQDLGRARQFYCEGLGFEASGAGNQDVVFIDMNGVVLALWGRASLAEDANAADLGSGFDGIALAQNVRSRAEVDAVLALAERAGAKIVKPAGETFWGGYAGYFADPDGHVWEIAHNPFWRLRDDGRIALDG